MTHISHVRSLRLSGVALLLLAGCSGEGLTSDGEELVGSQSQALQVSSALDCPNGVGSACTVPNLPLLHQGSNHVDVDIKQGVKDNGCYDTSIASITSMALTNRADRVQMLKNRTAKFHLTKAGDNGASPPVATTREEEQLSRHYRWSQTVYDQQAAGVNPITDQIFYFNEVLSDFSGASRTFPANCDPRTYGSCAWSTLAGTRAAGAAFRDFTSNVSHVTNDYVKALMSEGFGVVVAYGRYTPAPCSDNAAVTCFTRTGQHKVVFSGTQPGAYPLRINDVGDGARYNVTLSDDQSAFGRSNATSRFPNGKSKQTFLRYDPAVSPNAQVLFVDHIDGFSLALNSNKGITTTMDTTWQSGFTSLMPFTMNGQPHLLAYNKTTGKVNYDRVLADASGVDVVYNGTWARVWTHFAPYYVGNSPHFVLYDSASGELQYDEVPQNLNGLNYKGITWIPTGFTSVVPFTMTGRNYVLYYNKATGAARFDLINTAGSGAATMYSSTWGTGFTDFTFYYIGGEPYFVAYNASTGETQYDKVKPTRGLGIDVLGIYSDAANRKFANVAFQGPGHVMTYDSSGNGWVVRPTLDGRDGAAVWRDSLLPSATSTISFLQDGKSYQLMYDAASGNARSYRLNLF